MTDTIDTLQVGTNNLMRKPFHSNDLAKRVEAMLHYSRKQAHDVGQNLSGPDDQGKTNSFCHYPYTMKQKTCHILPYLQWILLVRSYW
jgi:DNA-binding response OmpR family regulator